jgi:uncharacterized damage-inducible protein DinB
MKRVVLLVVFVAFALPAIAQAQAAAPAGDPVSAALRGSFETIGRYLTASAEKMPEANFAFKPTPEVMSFGELLGHVADTHFFYCSRVKGEKNPNDGNDIQKKTAKADIQKGLADSIAYCSAVYKDMTDAKALEPLPPPVAGATPPPAPPTNMRVDGAKPQAAPPPPQPKLARLMGNLTHDWEHYGNIVTYLRIKGLVPPSSEPRR